MTWWRAKEVHKLEKELLETNRLLHKVLQLLNAIVQVITNNLPVALTITQEDSAMISGIVLGTSGTFQETFLPAGSALPKGASFTVTWSVDDPNVTLTPSADGTSVVAAVAASDIQGSFNITANLQSAALVSATNPTGVITSGPVNVPILPVPAPLPTSLAINQTA